MSFSQMTHFAAVLESQASRAIGTAGLLGLAALGIANILIPTFKLLSYIDFYFLRSSPITRYLSKPGDPPPSAIVTGATDGIGKAIAAELAAKGFNVVLHGRNEKKLEAVKADLVQRFPARKFRIFVFDASSIQESVSKLESAVQTLMDINLKILVNNVGGAGPVDPTFQSIFDLSSSDITAQMDLNITFTVLLTKFLMPKLRRPEPTLILNIGSAATEMPGIYQTAYAGSKGFIKSWSNALNDESIAEGWNVKSVLLLVGGVITEKFAAQGMKSSWSMPPPATFAKSVVRNAGSDYASLYPHWGHRAFFALILQLPKSMQISAIKNIAKDLMHKKAA